MSGENDPSRLLLDLEQLVDPPDQSGGLYGTKMLQQPDKFSVLPLIKYSDKVSDRFANDIKPDRLNGLRSVETGEGREAWTNQRCNNSIALGSSSTHGFFADLDAADRQLGPPFSPYREN